MKCVSSGMETFASDLTPVMELMEIRSTISGFQLKTKI